MQKDCFACSNKTNFVFLGTHSVRNQSEEYVCARVGVAHDAHVFAIAAAIRCALGERGFSHPRLRSFASATTGFACVFLVFALAFASTLIVGFVAGPHTILKSTCFPHGMCEPHDLVSLLQQRGCAAALLRRATASSALASVGTRALRWALGAFVRPAFVALCALASTYTRARTVPPRTARFALDAGVSLRNVFFVCQTQPTGACARCAARLGDESASRRLWSTQ